MSPIRAFTAADTPACLALFDGNVPQFFGVHERADFATYLQQPARPADYLVIERHGRVVACGGLAMDDALTAAFCWGMVERAMHRQGLGSELAHALLQQARARGARRVVLSTSQHSCDFYRAQGFEVTGVVSDGHGPDLDAVGMALSLA